MEQNKRVYWGYGIAGINEQPKVGKSIELTKVEVFGKSTLGAVIQQQHHETKPIVKVQRIAENMSILWTEEEGYAVYWTES